MNNPAFIVTQEMVTILADALIDRSKRNGSGKQRYNLDEDAQQLGITTPHLQAIYTELFRNPPEKLVRHCRRLKVRGVGEWIRHEY